MESDDGKYVSELSTILVATIQEVKDRVSQIEYIFCSQIFSSIQNISKNLKKTMEEARNAADEAFLSEKNSLLDQIEKIHLEKYQILQENKALQLERKKQMETAESLLLKLSDSEKRTGELEAELHEKSTEVSEGIELERKLLQLVQETKFNALAERSTQMREIEQIKTDQSAELERLRVKSSDLELELERKNEEAIKGGELVSHLARKMGSWESRLMSKPVDDERGLAGAIERADTIADKLIHALKLKDEELQMEKKKMNSHIGSYKNLKSQYNFLCRKFGLSLHCPHSNEETQTQDPTVNLAMMVSAVEELNNVVPPKRSRTIEPESGKKPKEVFESRSLEGRTNGWIDGRAPVASTRRSFKNQTTSRTDVKAMKSHWRGTRAGENQVGFDPHDDFLDTPLENAREKMNEVRTDGARRPVPSPLPPSVPPALPDRGEFKYVEPVRKRAEREALKGMECRQCEKFYDAVLPREEKECGGRQGPRCEHHDNVSRHRYRFAPPLTPQGFWDLGFETED